MANSLLVPLAFFCIGASTFLFFTMLDNTLVFSNIYLSCTLADSLRKSSDILAITTNHLLILSDLPQPRFYSLRHEGYWLFTWKKIEEYNARMAEEENYEQGCEDTHLLTAPPKPNLPVTPCSRRVLHCGTWFSNIPSPSTLTSRGSDYPSWLSLRGFWLAQASQNWRACRVGRGSLLQSWEGEALSPKPQISSPPA